MKQKTIQEQYILLKEGKINPIDFLKKAKREFPSLITSNSSLNDTETILKTNHLINENYMDLKPMMIGESKPKESWETSFQNFLKEAKNEEVKSDTDKVSKYVEDSYKKNYGGGEKNHPNKISFQQYLNGVYFESYNEKNEGKTLEEVITIVNKNLEKDFQYYLKNQYKGIEGIGLTAMEDPKEPKGKHASSGYGDLDKDTKSLLKENIILKSRRLGLNSGLMKMINENIRWNDSEYDEYKKQKSGLVVKVDSQDINSFENWLDQSSFYAEKESDGVYFFEEDPENFDNLEKFLQIEMASEDISVQFEGQGGNLNEAERFIPHVQLHENIEEGDEVIYDGEKYKIEKISDDGRVYIYPSEESKLLGRLPSVWVYPEDLEIKGSLHENKDMNLQQKLKEIERGGVVAALESKINAIQEEIDSRQEKITSISENEALSEFVDKNQIKGIEKEIKELEKHKAKLEKTLDKANGGKKPKKQVVDEDDDVNDDESVEESYYEYDDERYWEEKDDEAYAAAYDDMDDEIDEDFDEDEWTDDNEYLGGEHDFKNHPIQEGYSVNDKIDFLSGIRYPEQQDMLEFGNLDKLSPKTIQTLFESYFPHLNNKKIIKG